MYDGYFDTIELNPNPKCIDMLLYHHSMILYEYWNDSLAYKKWNVALTVIIIFEAFETRLFLQFRVVLIYITVFKNES